MTEKEKAEAYDEALERARAINNGKDVDVESGTTICEYIFPELKESEDEKIRKEIISILRNAYWTSNRNRFNELVTWLEKQGDKDKLIQELGEYKVKYTQEVLEKHINSMNNKDDERLRKTTIAFLKDFAEKGYENAVECIDWIEKQGEDKKEINNFDVLPGLYKCIHRMFDGTPDGRLLFEIGNVYKCLSKHDRAEFEVSYGHSVYLEDPVVCKYFIPFESKDEQTSPQTNERTWTIEDAKDGDVLFTSSTASHETFIFKSIDEKGNAECYFAYDSEDGFREGKYHFIGRATNCKPATKEQRDLLFQKMKEAGYEWDAEKKELKKK